MQDNLNQIGKRAIMGNRLSAPEYILGKKKQWRSHDYIDAWLELLNDPVKAAAMLEEQWPTLCKCVKTLHSFDIFVK